MGNLLWCGHSERSHLELVGGGVEECSREGNTSRIHQHVHRPQLPHRLRGSDQRTSRWHLSNSRNDGLHLFNGCSHFLI